MSTKIFFASLIFGTLVSATAQTTSFEASEGFTPGALHNQNGWTVLNPTLANVSIVDDNKNAADGDNYLKVIADNAAITIESPDYDIVDPQVTVSQDIFFDDLNASRLDVTVIDTDIKRVSKVSFYNTGNIEVLDRDNDGNYVTKTIGTYAPKEWTTLKVSIDFIANVIKYYVKEQLLYSGKVISGTHVNKVSFMSSNISGISECSIDNLQVVPAVLDVKENELASQFAVYPNPATAVINVANKSAKITAVTLTDLNGRTVKQLSYDNLSNVTVNTADLSAGMYLMHIKSSEGNATKKIVKN